MSLLINVCASSTMIWIGWRIVKSLFHMMLSTILTNSDSCAALILVFCPPEPKSAKSNKIKSLVKSILV
ncbi:hypothetical protein V2P34_00920 [Mycoplasma capricolum subsp. capricolum]|uniref:hypothetical protein n=1 Tax=Mycoplasma capricolum TaxID=2095 RepID=UPI003DA4E59E